MSVHINQLSNWDITRPNLNHPGYVMINNEIVSKRVYAPTQKRKTNKEIIRDLINNRYKERFNNNQVVEQFLSNSQSTDELYQRVNALPNLNNMPIDSLRQLAKKWNVLEDRNIELASRQDLIDGLRSLNKLDIDLVTEKIQTSTPEELLQTNKSILNKLNRFNSFIEDIVVSKFNIDNQNKAKDINDVWTEQDRVNMRSNLEKIFTSNTDAKKLIESSNELQALSIDTQNDILDSVDELKNLINQQINQQKAKELISSDRNNKLADELSELMTQIGTIQETDMGTSNLPMTEAEILIIPDKFRDVLEDSFSDLRNIIGLQQINFNDIPYGVWNRNDTKYFLHRKNNKERDNWNNKIFPIMKKINLPRNSRDDNIVYGQMNNKTYSTKDFTIDNKKSNYYYIPNITDDFRMKLVAN